RQRQHLAGRQVKVDTVDRTSASAAAQAEVDGEPAGRQDRLLGHDASLDEPAGRTRTHEATRSGPAGHSSTSVVAHSGRARGHRGWKAHPDGTAAGSGGSPPSPRGRPRAAGSPILGKAAARAPEYGCRGSPNSSWAGPISTTRPAYMT